MIAIVNIINGEPSASQVKIDGVVVPHVLTAQEIIDLAAAVTAMQAVDQYNCEWIVDVDKDVSSIEFIFKDTRISSSITDCSKGGFVDENMPTINTPLVKVVDSILDAVIV